MEKLYEYKTIYSINHIPYICMYEYVCDLFMLKSSRIPL